jgi:carbon-monoxide dehydrogenase medium subunit
MAGGQSLMPMMNFRVVQPALIVDINRLIELDYVRERADGGLTIGALARHHTLETSPLVAHRFPIIPETMKHVAHLAIRNQGTIGGSLSHADPAAELPMLTRLMDATIVAQSVTSERLIPASEFFVSALTSSLADDEIVVRIEFPGVRHNGWAFDEVARRTGDFALAAVGVLLEVAEGQIAMARIAMMGLADTPLRCEDAEVSLRGHALSDQIVARAIEAACTTLEPRRDLQASPEFRRHLAGVLLRRTLRKAWVRATGDQDD